MQIVETLNEGLKRAYTLTLTAKDIDARVEEEVKAIAPQIRMPGFRPGKVPSNLIRKMHGPALQREALDKSIREGVEKVIAENKLRPAMQPNVELTADYEEGMDAEVKVAAKFPDIKFEHATGYKMGDNLGIYNARFYEGRYVIGQIAAKQSKAGVAGYIVSFPIPEVVMGINAFMLGAQSVNPDFKVKIVWVNSWFDPGKEADAAKALFDQGADIIVQHTDSTAPLQVAQERGLHGFGQASDMITFAPKSQYTAIVDDWGPYYIERIGEVLAGTWKPEDRWEGIKEGAVHMAPYTNLPDDVAAKAKETEAKIAGGWNPFTGPVAKQDGSEWLKAGEVADDKTLLGMNFYIKGVDDKLPQ